MDNESLFDRIIRHEGFCSFPKPDAKGMYEIGYGHDITEDQAQHSYATGITAAEAYDILEQDIASIKTECGRTMPWLLGLDDCRQSVIYEMVYQLGLQGVLDFHQMIVAVREQDWQRAADNMLWNNVPNNTVPTSWHTETPSRCEELAGLMLKG